MTYAWSFMFLTEKKINNKIFYDLTIIFIFKFFNLGIMKYDYILKDQGAAEVPPTFLVAFSVFTLHLAKK